MSQAEVSIVTMIAYPLRCAFFAWLCCDEFLDSAGRWWSAQASDLSGRQQLHEILTGHGDSRPSQGFVVGAAGLFSALLDYSRR